MGETQKRKLLVQRFGAINENYFHFGLKIAYKWAFTKFISPSSSFSFSAKQTGPVVQEKQNLNWTQGTVGPNTKSSYPLLLTCRTSKLDFHLQA